MCILTISLAVDTTGCEPQTKLFCILKRRFKKEQKNDDFLDEDSMQWLIEMCLDILPTISRSWSCPDFSKELEKIEVMPSKSFTTSGYSTLAFDPSVPNEVSVFLYGNNNVHKKLELHENVGLIICISFQGEIIMRGT